MSKPTSPLSQANLNPVERAQNHQHLLLNKPSAVTTRASARSNVAINVKQR